jgi:hypothetical protein
MGRGVKKFSTFNVKPLHESSANIFPNVKISGDKTPKND